MNTFHRCIAIAAFAFAASAFGPAAAIAAESGDMLTQRVSYKDLDLTSEAGAHTLYQRIKSAANHVCAPLSGRQLIRHMSQSTCVTGAVERAVKQVNEPTLTQYYLTRNPKSQLGPALAAKR